MTIIVTK
jgi:prevent-host-death family protein